MSTLFEALPSLRKKRGELSCWNLISIREESLSRWKELGLTEGIGCVEVAIDMSLIFDAVVDVLTDRGETLFKNTPAAIEHSIYEATLPIARRIYTGYIDRDDRVFMLHERNAVSIINPLEMVIFIRDSYIPTAIYIIENVYIETKRPLTDGRQIDLQAETCAKIANDYLLKIIEEEQK